jgi:hypothetical protein
VWRLLCDPWRLAEDKCSIHMFIFDVYQRSFNSKAHGNKVQAIELKSADKEYRPSRKNLAKIHVSCLHMKLVA